MRIQTTEAERREGRLDADHLEQAQAAIEHDGYVILGDVVDTGVLDALKPKLDEDTATLMRRGQWGGAGAVPGHLQQAMPRSKAHVHREIVANPLVIHVTSTILGKGVHNHFYNGNTNMPRSTTQPLHRDTGHLWPDIVHPTTSIVINISPVDVDDTNGATEIWPGSHRVLDPIGEVHVPPSDEERRRETDPPVRAVSRKGDAVLRDIRLWHRGVPNHSDEGRHMIGMVHSSWFYLGGVPIPVTAAAADTFTDDVLSTSITIVPDDYDYLGEFIKP